jgi:hypothetical protein
MAAAQVSGAAGLALSSQNMSTTALKADILGSVDRLPSLAGRVRTGGRLDVCKAIPACASTPPPPPPSPSPPPPPAPRPAPTPAPAPAPAPSLYGALAYAPSAGVHASFAPTNSTAQRDALRQCRKTSAQCRLAGWVYNGWIAFASDSTGRKSPPWGAGWASSKTRAANAALRACQARNRGKRCKVRYTHRTYKIDPHQRTRGQSHSGL